MSKDDLEKRVEILNEKLAKEKLILDSAIRRKKLTLDILEKEARKLSNSVIRMNYFFLALTIITLFLHLGSVFYKEFPFVYLCRIMVSGALGSYISMLMCEIRSERKRFCLLDESKK